MCISMICSHFVIHWKLVIIIIKTAKNSNAYHYYFKVIIGFQCLTTIRYVEQGIGWACTDPGGGGGGGGGGMGSEPHRKTTRYMGRSRSKPPSRAWQNFLVPRMGWGGGGGAIYSLECIRTDCLMEDQARGRGVTLYQLGAKWWLSHGLDNTRYLTSFWNWHFGLCYFATLRIAKWTCIISLGKNDITLTFFWVSVYT